MTVVFVSSLAHGGTCEMRRRALERLGHRAVACSYEPAFHSYSTWVRKLQWHLRAGPAFARINSSVTAAIETAQADMLWVEKGWFIWDSTLRAARDQGATYCVLYSPDNYFLRQNRSRHLWRGLSRYDLVVTTKTHNVNRLQARGARHVFLSGNAFDPDVHRPLRLSEEDLSRYGCDVSFIGRWEPEREIFLEAVARLGVRLAIWGFRWDRARAALVRRAFRGGPALGEDYAKAIAGSKINLCFLSRLARDAVTQRSVEIPACGGFMLAERTSEHLAHFEEGVEAAYFSSPAEMSRLVLYYLEQEPRRREIAQAGREKCLKAGFSYDLRLSEILGVLGVEPFSDRTN